MPEWKNSDDDAGMPSSPPKPLASWYAQGLSDGLGDRLLMFDNSEAPSLELLRFRSDFAQVPGFEAALRERVRHLSEFRHPAFARVRAVQRLEPDDDLALVSNCTPGKRLSELLHKACGPEHATALIRQLAPALVQLQQHDHGISHGALSPDRIVVSPEGRLTIVEHVIGPAIDALDLSPAHLGRIGIPLPPATAGATPRLDVAADWYQLGLVAVSVLIGRPVTAKELPRLALLLDRAAVSTRKDGPKLSPSIREWLERALQISGTPIASGPEARAALDELLRKEQPRDARRIEAPPAPASVASAIPSDPDPLDDLAGEAVIEQPPMAEASSTSPAPVLASLAEFLTEEELRTAAETKSRPAEAPSRSTEASSRPTEAPSRPTEAPPRPTAEAPSRPTHVRSLFGAVTPIEVQRESDRQSTSRAVAIPEPKRDPPPAWKKRSVGPRRVLHNPPAAGRTDAAVPPVAAVPVAGAVERTGFSTAVVVALVLTVIVEGGVIAWLARALWLAPQPAMAVQTGASGENVVVSNRPTDTAPLVVTTAPDLQWVRVTSAPAPTLPGSAAGSRPFGSIRITSPISLRIVEGGRTVGSVPGADLKLSPGRHDLELVNVSLAYSLKQTLDVEAGQSVVIHVAPPQGRVSLYAVPSAEVSIDGQVIGRTPLGPLPISLGEHIVTFRHAAGARDRQRVVVKAGETLRVIGNLRR